MISDNNKFSIEYAATKIFNISSEINQFNLLHFYYFYFFIKFEAPGKIYREEATKIHRSRTR